MDSTLDFLKYFLINAGATLGAILYWMAVENMQPPEMRQKVHEKLILVFILSLFLTPLGAWIISAIFRIRKIAPTLKDTAD